MLGVVGGCDGGGGEIEIRITERYHIRHRSIVWLAGSLPSCFSIFICEMEFNELCVCVHVLDE